MADPTFQEIHDEWLAQKPEGALHTPDSCPFCVESPTNGLEEGKQVADESVAALQSKDEEIVKLSAQVADLLAQANESAVEAKIAEARAEGETKVAELQAALDTAVLEAEKAKSDHAELVAMLETAAKEAEEAAGRDARWAGRLEQVKESASWFTDEQVAERQERWTAMSDDEFASLITDFKVATAAKPAPAAGSGPITPATALVASAGPAGTARSLLADVMLLREQGVDVRKVH